MFLDKPLRAYLDEAASDAPTPGGGSVAALAGALGSCMASMAAHFTVGRKKYAAAEEEVRASLAVLAVQREELLRCMEEDATVFEQVGAAYKLPKATESEHAARAAAIREALLAALAVPLRALRACVAALAPLPRLAEVGNPNLISDTGVAAILLEAAARAARLNVLVNLKGLADPEAAREPAAEMEALCAQAVRLRDAAISRVEKGVA